MMVEIDEREARRQRLIALQNQRINEISETIRAEMKRPGVTSLELRKLSGRHMAERQKLKALVFHEVDIWPRSV